MRRIYLDSAAAAPVVPAALRAFRKALAAYGNPASPHTEGRAAKAVLDDARREIARMAGAKSEHVVFTSGATEANNLIIQGFIAGKHKEGKENIHVLYADGAHASIEETLKELSTYGIEAERIPVTEGIIRKEDLVRLVRPTTVLVVLEAVSSETGARYDTRAVRHLLDQVRSGDRIALHVDATQLPLVESFERTRLGADTISLDAQKVGGVRGAGCLIVSAGVSIAPMMLGGGQERGLRSGTPSPALASAFAAALSEAEQGRDAFATRASQMRASLLADIHARIPDVLVNEGKENVPHIVNITLPSRDTDYLVALLDERGYAVSTKSACETDSVEGSRAVLALSGDPERASATLRVSFGPWTQSADIARFPAVLAEAVAFLDRTRVGRYT